MTGPTRTIETAAAPKVSVCVITYNQRELIEPCLHSVLAQQTDFDFEIVVGDDCSTDGTRERLLELQQRHPERLRLVLQPSNSGGARNYIDVHAAARGDYVCHLDGDDLMLPGKLQAQADVLDAHPDVAMTAHAVSVVGSSERVIGADPRLPAFATLDDLLMLGTYFVHSSVMYRRAWEYPHARDQTPIDFFLYVERASRGRIHLDRRVLGQYRQSTTGLSGDPVKRRRAEHLYDQAFDRALELGADPARVKAGRLRRRMAFAIAEYLAGDVAAYRRKVHLAADEMAHASLKHRVLHCLGGFTVPLRLYVRWRGLA